MADSPAISKPTEAEREKIKDVKTPPSTTVPPLTKPHRHVVSAQVQDVLTLLLVFRFLNAIILRTFFQPDEYFQALEPAWNMAFGDKSGAWLTWEWQYQLRSSLHPAIFGVAYKAAHWILSAIFPPALETAALEILPKIIQSVFAALGDFYTWRLATSIFGDESNVPWTALWMTVLNPWQWYCSTRTFSNSLETTLTIAALYYWPWDLLQDAKSNKQAKGNVNSLRISLILAAVAVLLRPTNLLIWLGVLTLAVTRLTLDGHSPIKPSTITVLAREIIICGSAVLAVSLVSDRLYFGFWTFPPYKWLYFNISQSLAVFYGHMPWHYYLSQGIPLLTTTFLPFALVGLYKATSSSKTLTVLQSNILKTLSFAVLSMVATLSVISHKEVRFIYPLLPILHILAAPYVFKFFTVPAAAPPTTTTTTATTATTAATTDPVTLRHKISLANLLSLNLLLAIYLSLFHQPAAISVVSFLRTEFERIHPNSLSLDSFPSDQGHPQKKELFALFLTPCHSTPWRSHLAYPALRARALTCEPPLYTAPGSREREEYKDEADRFYLPSSSSSDGEGGYGVEFLRDEMWGGGLTSGGGGYDSGGKGGGEEIPRYIVGFEGVEDVLRNFFEGDEKGRQMGVQLKKVWEGWNGAFNEDWRRSGKLVVWDTGVYETVEREERRYFQ
ncbi:Alg9-like mannosyltransferase family-domain-containing protein [Sordaria brevicollis]|uniref:Mannosyltransferase n=1 Tax=Sordaria brevicollis TaxID=83679 RepID=A0AAE0U629_SORBR|nr:Alg9-like mannosyltransferase family-domain-containing protein [Sordaria brevicollis]